MINKNDVTTRIHPELVPIAGYLQPVVMNDENVAQVRAMTDAMVIESMKNIPPNPNVTTQRITIPGLSNEPDVEISIYKSNDAAETAPAILSIHGGGLVSNSVLTEEVLNINLAQDIKGIVVSPEYRLAPENPYPAGLNDCYAALLWMAAHAAECGIDPERICVNGASAGAVLAVGCVIRAKNENGPRIAAEFLSVPMLDWRNETSSSCEIEDLRVWNRAQNIWCWEKYMGDMDRENVPAECSPAMLTDYEGMPPTFISQGAVDIFRDEAIDFAANLMRAGVETELHVFPGLFHGCEAYAPTADAIINAGRIRMNAIKKFLEKGYF